MNSPFALQIRAYEGDGLTFIIPSQHETRNLRLDGKDTPGQTPGSSTSMRRLDEHTLEMTDKVGEKVSDTREIKVSADGRTLTMTIHATGQSRPSIMVFDRE